MESGGRRTTGRPRIARSSQRCPERDRGTIRSRSCPIPFRRGRESAWCSPRRARFRGGPEAGRRVAPREPAIRLVESVDSPMGKRASLRMRNSFSAAFSTTVRNSELGINSIDSPENPGLAINRAAANSAPLRASHFDSATIRAVPSCARAAVKLPDRRAPTSSSRTKRPRATTSPRRPFADWVSALSSPIASECGGDFRSSLRPSRRRIDEDKCDDLESRDGRRELDRGVRIAERREKAVFDSPAESRVDRRSWPAHAIRKSRRTSALFKIEQVDRACWAHRYLAVIRRPPHRRETHRRFPIAIEVATGSRLRLGSIAWRRQAPPPQWTGRSPSTPSRPRLRARKMRTDE